MVMTFTPGTAGGAAVALVSAYGIFKGLPWSRVLYVGWSVIALAIGFAFFYTVSQVAAAGTEYRPFDYWHVPWGGRAPLRACHR